MREVINAQMGTDFKKFRNYHTITEELKSGVGLFRVPLMLNEM